MSEKKRWFVGYCAQFWIPVSLEGWILTTVFMSGLYLIYQVNGVSANIPFQISVHWPVIAEMLALVIGYYWIAKGHVDRRY